MLSVFADFIHLIEASLSAADSRLLGHRFKTSHCSLLAAVNFQHGSQQLAIFALVCTKPMTVPLVVLQGSRPGPVLFGNDFHSLSLLMTHITVSSQDFIFTMVSTISVHLHSNNWSAVNSYPWLVTSELWPQVSPLAIGFADLCIHWLANWAVNILSCDSNALTLRINSHDNFVPEHVKDLI